MSKVENLGTIKHFGSKIKNRKDGNTLTKDNYCKINNISSFRSKRVYTDEWCTKHYIKCMKNFDYNMKYFSQLDKNEFESSVTNFVQEHNFQEINNLNQVSEKCGYYLMVIDHYKQVYIGTSKDIKKRILSHWSKVKPFDRLIFGKVEGSILSIDSFRALDTTRIYAKYDLDVYTYESKYIESFKSKFLSNRMGGGKISKGPLGLMEALLSSRIRALLKL